MLSGRKVISLMISVWMRESQSSALERCRRLTATVVLAAGVCGGAVSSALPQNGEIAGPGVTTAAPQTESDAISDTDVSRGGPSSDEAESQDEISIDSETVEDGIAHTELPAIGDLPIDLSPWSMFTNADVVVKTVIVGLALASLLTWTIWLAKGVLLHTAKLRAGRAIRRLESSKSLGEATHELSGTWSRRGPVAALVVAAEREYLRSAEALPDGVKERVAIALSRIEARAGRNMASGTGLLATIGATAPFVGLFGTVWGIMNAFIGISKAQTTNLAVVAPGIAEALLATAIGLVAAIPAVIIYNVFARSIAGYRALLADASGEVLQHLSRRLEADALRGGGGDIVRPAAANQRATPAE